MFYALDPDSDGLVHGSCRMGVSGYWQTGGVCLLDQQPQLLDRELWGEHVAACSDHAAACHHLDHINLSLHPLSCGTHDFVRAADLAAEVAAVATRSGDRWIGGNDPGQPVVNLPLRVSPFHHVEVPVAKVTDRRHTSGELPSQRLDDHGVDLFRRIFRDPLQRHHAAVADEVDMRVDQPRKHGRIAVIDKVTVGWWLVPHRLNPDNATILDKHGGAAGPEISMRLWRTFVDASRRRIGPRKTVADQSQGVPLGMIQELARYWLTDYDWRKCEANLNALPQFITEIDGLDIHFIHVRSHHENALPLIVTHGWPGSIVEQLKIIDRLTNPTAHGASAADAFHVVIPSMPGYGFSGKPTSTGRGPERMGRAWAELMERLGYSHYIAQGGDWARSSSIRWVCRHLRDCSPSTPTCLPPFRLTSTRLPWPASRRRPVSQRRNDAPTNS